MCVFTHSKPDYVECVTIERLEPILSYNFLFHCGVYFLRSERGSQLVRILDLVWLIQTFIPERSELIIQPLFTTVFHSFLLFLKEALEASLASGQSSLPLLCSSAQVSP